jgi:hypothetical protein
MITQQSLPVANPNNVFMPLTPPPRTMKPDDNSLPDTTMNIPTKDDPNVKPKYSLFLKESDSPTDNSKNEHF